MPRDIELRVRMAQEEKQLLKRAADILNWSVSEYVRYIMVRNAEGVLREAISDTDAATTGAILARLDVLELLKEP